jgi:hypothetical protein
MCVPTPLSLLVILRGLGACATCELELEEVAWYVRNPCRQQWGSAGEGSWDPAEPGKPDSGASVDGKQWVTKVSVCPAVDCENQLRLDLFCQRI